MKYMQKVEIEVNGNVVTFEKDRNDNYYFNGLKLEILDCHNHYEFSLTGIDESEYKDTKSIILPNWVTRIQSQSIPESLKECLEYIYIYAPGVNVLENHALENCKALKICATNKVQKIGYGAFYGCSNLRYTPNLSHVKEMDVRVFFDCKNLTGHLTEAGEIVENEILIPKNLTELYATFENCISIQKVVFEERDGLTNNRQLYLDSTFEGCTKLSEIVGLFDESKNNSLVRIGKMAFKNTGFTKIVIPHNACFDKFAGDVFENSKNLKSIEIHVSLIPVGICSNCPNLTDVIIGDEVKIIGSHAFGFNPSLTSIDINNVTSIKEFAFGDSGITNVVQKNKNINISPENKEIKIDKDTFYQTPIQRKYKELLSRNGGLSL